MEASLDQAWEQLTSQVILIREEGVDVELDHFLEVGWSWSFQDGRYRVVGPGPAGWLPEVRRLKSLLAYSSGCLWRTVDGQAEMVTWREDGVGFRIEFVSRVADP